MFSHQVVDLLQFAYCFLCRMIAKVEVDSDVPRMGIVEGQLLARPIRTSSDMEAQAVA